MWSRYTPIVIELKQNAAQIAGEKTAIERPKSGLLIGLQAQYLEKEKISRAKLENLCLRKQQSMPDKPTDKL